MTVAQSLHQALRQALVAVGFVTLLTGGALAQDTAPSLTAVEKLYAELAKLPAAERSKRLEDGARKEGQLSFIHSWRGQLGSRHVAMFQKR